MAESLSTNGNPQRGTMGLASAAGSEPAKLQCCCGKDDCVYLLHNCSILSSVERDVHTAARMGQTLLARHEAYMASAERDRLELTARIEQLERDNTELEARNRSITEENKSLREELEQVNDTVRDAETKIGLLEATLYDSQREVRRLEHAADRAATLERQIAVLEEEQAEKGLSDLQEQLERMEKEAREERERHAQVIHRMERQRAVERELNTAAGRLKGAAAAKSMTDGKNNGKVVSHFVRDLLQDNANLQLGMAELREMLVNANDEIQMLREQLMYHQPAESAEPHSPKTLEAELAMKEPPTPPQAQRPSQELHVHHHFHVKHKPEARKPRKRRTGIAAGILTPPQLSAPGSPIAARFQRGSLAGPLLSPGPNDVPLPTATSSPAPRWSLQSQSQNPSEFAPSSAPSSPRSTNRDSVFDRVGELPSPASPATSLDPTSPGWKTAHRKKISELSLRSISETAMFPSEAAAHAVRSRAPLQRQRSRQGRRRRSADGAVSRITAVRFGRRTGPRGLRRVASHESIMSLSNGLDIHTLQARPSQLALKPLGLTAAGTNLSDVTAQPTLSSGSGKGRRGSVILRDSIAHSLPHAAASRRSDGGRVVPGPVRGQGGDESDTSTSGRSASRAPSSALGKLVSWRPWRAGAGGHENGDAAAHDGVVASAETSPSSTPSVLPAPAATAAPASAEPIPALSLPANAAAAACSTAASTQLSKSPQGSLSSATTTSTSTASTSGSATATRAKAKASAAMAAVFRAPGVNQPGPVPGFQELWAAQRRRAPPSKVLVDDQAGVQEALREVLEEES
ncbi:hypothetical protein VTH06DRAFT_7438 [Thermothelomyces fergusii]